jgi:PAS domain S-box-containing protein
VVLVFRDQTDERRAHNTLIETKERLQTVMNSVDALVYIADIKTHELLFINEYGRRIWGDSIVGQPCWKVLQGLDDPCSFCSNDRILSADGKATGVYQWEFQNRVNGRWYDVHDRAIEWTDGRMVRLEVATDITERKQGEVTLQESERELQRAQAMAHIGSWRFNLDTGVVTGSEEAGRIYGLENVDLSLQQIQAIPLAHYRQKLDEGLRRLVENGLPYDFEFEIRRPSDDTIRHIHSVAEFDAERNTVFGTIHDITERLNLEGQLRQAQKMESVGRLAGGVAHDFNNMLSVIIGYTELAMDTVSPDDQLHDQLGEIHNAAQRSATITRQLLAFARKQTIAPRVLDLNETVEGMLTMLRRLIGEDINLTWLPGRGIWPVKMDPAQIDQILANLCVNARDAIAGIGRITIETDRVELDEAYCAEHVGFAPGEFVLLTVSDDGCGMDRDIQEKLFEPFFTTKDMDKGTGLGLATVYGIVKQNKGFIHVYSEPAKGSTFRLYLPRYAGEAGEKKDIGVKLIPQAQGETILIVEDEIAILRLGQTILERLGYTVLTAASPGAALQQAEAYKGTIDLLITDVVMPEMNGRDLSGLMKKRHPDIRILFMSGYTANVIAHHGVLDDDVIFMQKPFSTQEIATKVRQALAEE